MKKTFIIILISILFYSCNYTTHKILSGNQQTDSEDPEPNYEISLDRNYQDFVSYIFMGNRSENFSTFFNKFYTSLEDFDDAMKEYRVSKISQYNSNIDSVNSIPIFSQTAKDKLNGIIAKCSKILQYNKNSRYLDDAVLLIGKVYYYLQDYYQAERKFNEFFSKLIFSDLTDEAILFLGRTKIKLKKYDEGLILLNRILDNSKDIVLSSDAALEIAFYYISRKDFTNATKYLEKSIDISKEKIIQSERRFILGKIYMKSDIRMANEEFLKVIKLTSDFELTFYSKLNYGKTLNLLGEYTKAYEIFEDLSRKYRDYPEYRQFSDLEIANTLFFQKNFKKGINKYFEVIIVFKGTINAADAYYYLAKYYETIEKNYFKALTNYKRVNEQSGYSEFSSISSNRTTTLTKYFNLIATINDTTAGEIPKENPDLEKYRIQYEIEKGIYKEQEDKGKYDKGKLGGVNSSADDSIINRKEVIKKKGEDSLLIKNKIKSGDSLFQKNNGDDSLNLINKINEDSLREANKKIKEIQKFNAYYELAEIFLYGLNRPDSAEYYLNAALNKTNEIEKQSKVKYTLATLYKNINREEEANILFGDIIKYNPNSIYANESRKILGLKTIEFETDECDKLYKEAEKQMNTLNYISAIETLKKIFTICTDNILAPKSIYTISWIFGNIYLKKDSTIYYYEKLVTLYPQSIYALAINDRYNYLNSLQDTSKHKPNILNDTSKVIFTDTTFLNNQDTSKLLKHEGEQEIKKDSTNVEGEKNN